MPDDSPSVIILAGPNGAGKSTAARTVLAETLGVTTFVNADTIAQGLSGFDPASTAIEAGRIMLERLHELAERREDFAFETTLAARSLAGWLYELKLSGYAVHLLYFWLESADLAVSRVAARVAGGGHDIPEETIRRRFLRSLANFHQLYSPLATTWQVYNNSLTYQPELIAEMDAKGTILVSDRFSWELFGRNFKP